MIATATRKTLYHSELRTLSEDGPVRLQIVEEPRESKYAGREPYCLVKLAEGDDAGRYYAIETPEIFTQLQGLPRNQWLSVVALGSRESAVLEVVDQEPTAAAPVANRIAQDMQQAEQPRESLARDYWAALEVATALVDTFKQRHGGREPTEAERSIATSLWIEMNRSGGRRPLSS